MALLSVHLPVRDAEATVMAAVTSALRAMPRDAELVAFDDGSRDRTVELLTSIGDRRVKVLTSQVSRGPGAVSRDLMERTDSLYVARMDADDLCSPLRFALQLRALRAGADFCFSSIVRFHTKPLRLRAGLPMPITAEAMPLHLLAHNPLCQPTMTATRAAVETAGSYRAVLAEDYDLNLRALANGLRVVRLATPLLGYRSHNRQVSGNPEFALRALNEKAVQESYAQFVERLLGVEPTWLPYLWPREPLPWRERAPALAELARVIDERATHLSAPQRFVLSRTTRHLLG